MQKALGPEGTDGVGCLRGEFVGQGMSFTSVRLTKL